MRCRHCCMGTESLPLSSFVFLRCRSATKCGPLVYPILGDPFLRSQRVVVIFSALLASLFFNVLFFQGSLEPICLDPDDDTTCKAFSCPSYDSLGLRIELVLANLCPSHS